jgi:hypothetical protein
MRGALMQRTLRPGDPHIRRIVEGLGMIALTAMLLAIGGLAGSAQEELKETSV